MKHTILSAALAIAIMGATSAGFANDAEVSHSHTSATKTTTSEVKPVVTAPVTSKSATTTTTSTSTTVSKEKHSEIAKECRGEHKTDKAAFKACVKEKTAAVAK